MVEIIASINEGTNSQERIEGKIRAALENRYYKLAHQFLLKAQSA